MECHWNRWGGAVWCVGKLEGKSEDSGDDGGTVSIGSSQ